MRLPCDLHQLRAPQPKGWQRHLQSMPRSPHPRPGVSNRPRGAVLQKERKERKRDDEHTAAVEMQVRASLQLPERQKTAITENDDARIAAAAKVQVRASLQLPQRKNCNHRKRRRAHRCSCKPPTALQLPKPARASQQRIMVRASLQLPKKTKKSAPLHGRARARHDSATLQVRAAHHTVPPVGSCT